MDSNKNIGIRIKQIRISKGMTLEDFGKKFDPPADKSLVSKWENGKSLPNNERIKKISELGNVSIEYLLNGNRTIFDISQDEINELQASSKENNIDKEKLEKYIMNSYLDTIKNKDLSKSIDTLTDIELTSYAHFKQFFNFAISKDNKFNSKELHENLSYLFSALTQMFQEPNDSIDYEYNLYNVSQFLQHIFLEYLTMSILKSNKLDDKKDMTFKLPKSKELDDEKREALKRFIDSLDFGDNFYNEIIE